MDNIILVCNGGIAHCNHFKYNSEEIPNYIYVNVGNSTKQVYIRKSQIGNHIIYDYQREIVDFSNYLVKFYRYSR